MNKTTVDLKRLLASACRRMDKEELRMPNAVARWWKNHTSEDIEEPEPAEAPLSTEEAVSLSQRLTRMKTRRDYWKAAALAMGHEEQS